MKTIKDKEKREKLDKSIQERRLELDQEYPQYQGKKKTDRLDWDMKEEGYL